MTATASPLVNADTRCQGAGMLNLKVARDVPTPPVVQRWQTSSGTGLLELARGSAHVADGETELRGERDILGTVWDGDQRSAASWSEQSWSGGFWDGNRWADGLWYGTSWTAKTWSAKTWSAAGWDAKTWSAKTWSTEFWR